MRPVADGVVQCAKAARGGWRAVSQSGRWPCPGKRACAQHGMLHGRGTAATFFVLGRPIRRPGPLSLQGDSVNGCVEAG